MEMIKLFFWTLLFIIILSVKNYSISIIPDSTKTGSEFSIDNVTTVQEGRIDTDTSTNESSDEPDEYANEEDSVEIFIIDNFITAENTSQFVISFYTSLPSRSKIMIDGTNEIIISKELSESHRDTIDISKIKFKSRNIFFVIEVEDSAGRRSTTEKIELELPSEVDVSGESNFLLLCLFGGTVFALPSPNYVSWGGKEYWGITKEIPLIFIRSGGFQYPLGYFSVEYSYIWNAPVNNFLRIGYKHIIEIPGIEYISPGLSGFTNFFGFNGLSPEVSIGWFKIYNVFTVYSRFRFNVKPGDKLSEFRDISIGLYSGFFAIYF